MKVEIEPGTYVVAVSGGVDSVVLLHLLKQQDQSSVIGNQESAEKTETKKQKPDYPNYQLVVAHFDHGIRHDSNKDLEFVANLAKSYGLKFESKREELGPDASEELARIRRYKFLNEVAHKHNAGGIITAHHKDDQLETAVFNLLRGTNRSGLSSLRTNEDIIRPLLAYKKDQIIKYARDNKLNWREDPTNKSDKYTRNKIRQILQKVPEKSKTELEKIIGRGSEINLEMNDLVKGIFDYSYNPEAQSIDREFFISLPHKVSRELIVFWLKKTGAKYDKKLIEKIVNDLKTLSSGSRVDINKQCYFELDAKQISLRRRTSV